ncbi:hypothetical protein FHR83_003110 [Actinoplanes campanulatus]|uniref:ABC-2 type transporter transmembrane domain-containing protein n=1 Tax=Actinoplanes campanulatus TaxID=113559 RepID=A0A7W5FEJ8_9ACTN|nr:ABC transporter permease [Actinoplanes campanulatus]MBB3095440.1 hypothetical protein [Actinoplanes campanulatus]GGN09008.1 hypothetical protein GCM10010109_18050 [Actinoplanes campanulatus]GID36323.1 hypothetical protein Aca09nite_28290 [Actinoplanes campanulatus]
MDDARRDSEAARARRAAQAWQAANGDLDKLCDDAQGAAAIREQSVTDLTGWPERVVATIRDSLAAVDAKSTALKRLLGTPLSFRWYFAGRVSAALIVALTAATVLAVVGTIFLGIRLEAARLPALLLAIVAGSLCFAALGLAVAALLPSARSIVPVTLGTLLPLCLISEIFVVGDVPLPGGLTTVADVFPLRHLLRMVIAATGSAATGSTVPATALPILAGWTALALAIVRWRGLGTHRDPG